MEFPTRYLIIGMQRSGTTVTHECLGGHPHVSTLEPELNARSFSAGFDAFTHGKIPQELRPLSYYRLFDALAGLSATDQTTHLGVKCALSHPCEAEALVHSLQTFLPEAKAILVFRNDLVAQYASLIKAQKTRRWHASEPSNRTVDSDVRVRIGQRELLYYVANAFKIGIVLKKLVKTHSVFQVSYERDILPGNLEYCKKLLVFLGLPLVEMTWSDAQKLSPPPEDYVANYPFFRGLLEEARQKSDDIEALNRLAAQNEDRVGKLKSKIAQFGRALLKS